MASLKVLLGLLPKTSKIEDKEEALIREYNEYKEFTASDELAHYEELDHVIHSSDFHEVVKTIKTQKFNDTEEYSKEQEYLQMKRSKRIKDYFKIKKSDQLQNFLAVEESPELNEFKKLEKFVHSEAFKEAKSAADPKEFKETKDHKKWEMYNTLKKNSKIKDYFTFKESSKYQVYKELGNSDEFKKYTDLEEFVNSQECKDVKQYMALSPKKKYEQSDEYKAEQEYLQLKKSDKIVWYYKLKDSSKFDVFKKWEITFEDDFNGQKINRKKWLTRFYYGEKFLKDSYVLEGDKQYFTDEDNFTIQDSILHIVTKKENIEGNVWTPEFGFLRKQFNYSSGIINTGKSFRQKYGIFKAKVRINPSHSVMHAFWMLAKTQIPHIDIFKSNKSKISMGSYWGSGENNGKISKSINKVGSGRFSKDFYIYSLEWTAEKLVWKINNTVIHTQIQGIPDQPMYILFCSVLKSDISDTKLPVSLDIDWVRCYKAVDTVAD